MIQLINGRFSPYHPLFTFLLWITQLVVISHALLSILLLLHWPAGKEEREKGRGNDGYAIKEEGCSLVLNEAYLALENCILQSILCYLCKMVIY